METHGYIIRIQARLSQAMLENFEGLSIEPFGESDSILVLPTTDQAALFGILLRIRDLGIRLFSVMPF
jgi:hypothetical protein